MPTKGTPVSAFAVNMAVKGKLSLNEPVAKEIAKNVEALHSDSKFNKKVEEIAQKYEKTLLNQEQRNKNKRKKNKAMAEAIENAKLPSDTKASKLARKERRQRSRAEAQKDAQKKKRESQSTIKPTPAQETADKKENGKKTKETPISWFEAPGKKKRKIQEADSSEPIGTLRESKKSRKQLARERKEHQQKDSEKNANGAAKQAKTKQLKLIETTEAATVFSADGELLSVQSKKEPKRISPVIVMNTLHIGSGDKKRTSRVVKLTNPKWNPKTKLIEHEEIDNEHVNENSTQESEEEEPVDLVENEDDDDDDDMCYFEHTNPDTEALDVFKKLIHPIKYEDFMKTFWTKKAVHIKRNKPKYYNTVKKWMKDGKVDTKWGPWFSTQELNHILVKKQLRFGTNIDLTTYKNNKRETLNPSGRAYPAVVWDHYQQGCSVRLLNPQTYSLNVWYLLSTLQDLFGCMVGANVYLTPAGTQGFAPHYDDIEGFVMQLEGKKRWRVYPPRTDADIWPLYSSPNMTDAELFEPLIDCVLEPGDLLYFPRGAIHQAMAQDNEHSLHLTVSTHQKNTWSDLLSTLLPAALADATENDTSFRESLPIDYMDYTGIAFQDLESEGREVFMEKVRTLMEKLITYAPIDGACDQMAKKFIHDSLPPCLDVTEEASSIAVQGEQWEDGKGVCNAVELQPDTSIRLIRKHSLRLVQDTDDELKPCQTAEKIKPDSQADITNGLATDDDEDLSDTEATIRLYYNTDNDRLYHGNAIQFIELDTAMAPVIEQLQLVFPEFIHIDDLPCDDLTNKMGIAQELYDRGLLVTEKAIEAYDDDGSFNSEEYDDEADDIEEPELLDDEGLSDSEKSDE